MWGAPEIAGEDIVHCHGDPGPWNFIWRDNEAVGLIDWDYLHPAPRLDDVAHALRWFVPYRSDELAEKWHHFPEIPDRRHRIRVFLSAYGDLADFDVVDAVATRIQATIDHCRALADTGQEPQRTWVADGFLEHDEARSPGSVVTATCSTDCDSRPTRRFAPHVRIEQPGPTAEAAATGSRTGSRVTIA